MVSKRSKQVGQWAPGGVVKVGFLTLRVVSGPHAVKDYMPDIYHLESLDGMRRYRFIPHHGLTREDS